LLDELLSLIQEHWIHLVGLVAEEEDPDRLRTLVAELDQLLEARKLQRSENESSGAKRSAAAGEGGSGT
jgi:hypothetical protein